MPDSLAGEVVVRFPMERLADKPALGVDHDFALAVFTDNVKAYRRLRRPVTAEEHFLYPGHAFLSAELVIEFTEEEEHLLLHLPGCIGSIYGLCHRHDLDTEFSQLVGKPLELSLREKRSRL